MTVNPGDLAIGKALGPLPRRSLSPVLVEPPTPKVVIYATIPAVGGTHPLLNIPEVLDASQPGIGKDVKATS